MGVLIFNEIISFVKLMIVNFNITYTNTDIFVKNNEFSQQTLQYTMHLII